MAAGAARRAAGRQSRGPRCSCCGGGQECPRALQRVPRRIDEIVPQQPAQPKQPGAVEKGTPRADCSGSRHPPQVSREARAARLACLRARGCLVVGVVVRGAVIRHCSGEARIQPLDGVAFGVFRHRTAGAASGSAIITSIVSMSSSDRLVFALSSVPLNRFHPSTAQLNSVGLAFQNCFGAHPNALLAVPIKDRKSVRSRCLPSLPLFFPA
jgi:hypothetical protein